MYRSEFIIWPFRSLRRRLLFLACLATLPAVLFTFFAAKNERIATIIRTEQDALHFAQIIGREHAHQIKGAYKLLEWLGKHIATNQFSLTVSDKFLRALLVGHPQLANIGILSPEGEVLVSAYTLSSYESWKDNPVFKAALNSKKVVAGTYALSPIFKNSTLNHAYAVRDKSGKVISVLFNGLDLKWLSEIGTENDFLNDFSFFIVDHKNNIVSSSNKENIIWDTQPIGKQLISLGDRASPDYYFVKTPLQGAPYLNIAVRIPYDQILGQANRVFFRTLIGLGLLTLFIVIAVFVSTELSILRTLRKLTYTVQKMSQGDLTARMALPLGQNEFYSLAKAFNLMADSLSRRQQQMDEAHTQLRALTQRLQTAREAEAAHISRELHDEVGQVLTSIKIDISRLKLHCRLKDKSDNNCAEELEDKISQINTSIMSAIDFVRVMSSKLRPTVLDKLGLVAALEWQANEISSRNELVINIHAKEFDQSLDEQMAMALFRITQEALTNISRHAEAKNIDIYLSANAYEIMLKIEDDGKGISSGVVNNNSSLGIIGMRERAILVNGNFSIYNATKKSGTVIQVTVPLSPTKE